MSLRTRFQREGPARGMLLALLAALGLLVPDSAWAHAFGARYDLPLPLWLYLGAAGAAVAFSFVIMAVLAGGAVQSEARWNNHGLAAANERLKVALGSVSVVLLGVVLIAGYVGPDSPTRNFASVFVWILWWVGLAFIQALVIDIWRIANPWRVLSGAAAALARAGLHRASFPLLSYPNRIGYWPALILFLAFAWLELVSDVGEQPRALARIASAYTVLTVTGALVFGVERWFRYADPFSVVFGMLGRFAPLEWVRGGRNVRVRAPGSGLLMNEPAPPSLTALVVCLLATVSFDGILETPLWAGLLDWVTESETLRTPLLALQSRGVNLLQLVETAGLLAAALVFVTVFLSFAYLIDAASGDPRGLRVSAGSFVLTLVPIAVGYHVAHYLSYLLVAGQLIVPLLSDPFGLGWDLFGTRGYEIDVAVVNARFVWYTAVITIVVGHVIAVYLAHVTALRVYEARTRALRSQVPMLVLMVGYTMSSLWILSQPIVET